MGSTDELRALSAQRSAAFLPGSSRARENALLDRCVEVARSGAVPARNEIEANFFLVAAAVLRWKYPTEVSRWKRAGDAYVSAHPGSLLTSDEVLQRGWVISLPRLRDMLIHKLTVGQHAS